MFRSQVPVDAVPCFVQDSLHMGKTAILAVDDDPPVLAAVARDLRSRYGKDYRVVRAPSGAEALDALRDLLGRGDTVSVLVAISECPA